MAATAKPGGKQLPKVDISKIKAADIDNMSPDALRAAVRSVVRDPNLAASHRDHRSHSSVDSQLMDRAINVSNPAAGGVKTAGGIGSKTKTPGGG